MRELLLAFILALIVGSIINSMQKPQEAAHNPTNASAVNSSANAVRTDSLDFNSLPAVDNVSFNDQVIGSLKPVFIDCYSPNNLSSDQMVPLVVALAQEHLEKVKVAKLNVMDNLKLCQNYQVDAVPTFLVFDKGQLVSRLSGVVPKAMLESMLAPYLKSKSN